jgi:peptide/nickel transport system substrate-binding protein
MRQSRPTIRTALQGFAVAMSLLLATSAPARAATEKVLRIVMHSDLKMLDPLSAVGANTRHHGYFIYDVLFSQDSKFTPQKQMVEDWTLSTDKLTYSFRLRPGLKFHDGAAVRAVDCVASIERWMKVDTLGAVMAQYVEKFTVDDERSFTLKLRKPFGMVVEALAKPSSTPVFIYPERFARMAPGAREFQPIGSGPFLFKQDEFRPGLKAVYVKNPAYVSRKEPADYLAGGKVVHFDRVEWLVLPDDNTAAAALAAGEIDYFERPPGDLFKQLRANKNIRMGRTDPFGDAVVLNINHLHPPFNDVKARQALLYMVDQSQYVQIVAGDDGYSHPCAALFLCGGPYESAVGAVKPDINKAKQLLKEGGYKGEKVVVLQQTNHPYYGRAAQMTIFLLRKLGVNVQVQAMDTNSLIARRYTKEPVDKGGWNIAHSGMTGVEAYTPVTNVWMISSCEKARTGWPCDAQMERLRAAWAAESDPNVRKSLADQIQQRAYETVPYVPLGQYVRPFAYRAELTGLLHTLPVFWNVDRK